MSVIQPGRIGTVRGHWLGGFCGFGDLQADRQRTVTTTTMKTGNLRMPSIITTPSPVAQHNTRWFLTPSFNGSLSGGDSSPIYIRDMTRNDMIAS